MLYAETKAKYFQVNIHRKKKWNHQNAHTIEKVSFEKIL